MMSKLRGFDEVRTPESWKKRLYGSIENGKQVRIKHRGLSAAAAVAVIAIAVLASGTALAIGLGWHAKLAEYLKPGEEQMEALDGAVDTPEASVTSGGITVTVRQTLADSLGIYVLYELTAPEDIELSGGAAWGFAHLDVPREETDEYVSVGSSGETVLEQSGNKRTALMYMQTSSPFKNGEIELLFRDLGYYDTAQDGRSEFVPLVEGEWKLSWEFTYVDSGRSIDVDLPLNIDGGDNTVTRVVISPMTACVYITGDAVVESVQPVIKFRDGTERVYSSQDRNTSFWYYLADEENETYVNQLYCRFETITDISDIAAIQIGDVEIPMEG